MIAKSTGDRVAGPHRPAARTLLGDSYTCKASVSLLVKHGANASDQRANAPPGPSLFQPVPCNPRGNCCFHLGCLLWGLQTVANDQSWPTAYLCVASELRLF